MQIPPHLERILNLALWAPSGDNTQPWCFEILGEEHILVHGFDTRDHVVYDLDGHASQLAIGALLENICIAASGEGRGASIKRRLNTPDTHLLFDVHLQHLGDTTPSPLLPYIKTRVVQRRPMSTLSLSAEQKQILADSLPQGYTVQWHDDLSARWRIAKILFSSAKIRLIIPEAYAVHKAVIEWGAQFSTDKIPGQAVGVDALTERFMHWVLASWERVEFFNTYFLGHIPPRLQLDLLPGLLCGAHFALIAPVRPKTVDDYISAGRAMQSFWLSATRLGWLAQPEMTPLIFARYHRQCTVFTTINLALGLAAQINEKIAGVLGKEELDKTFFMARIGSGPAPKARSTRKPLCALMRTGTTPSV